MVVVRFEDRPGLAAVRRLGELPRMSACHLCGFVAGHVLRRSAGKMRMYALPNVSETDTYRVLLEHCAPLRRVGRHEGDGRTHAGRLQVVLL